MRINKSIFWKRDLKKTRLNRLKVCLFCLYFETKKMSFFFFLYYRRERVWFNKGNPNTFAR